MKILQIMIQIEDDGSIEICDAVEHEGHLWLVPEWRAYPAEGIQKPARMISLEGIEMSVPRADYPADFFLDKPMLRDVLEDPGKSQTLAVLEAPDLSMPLTGVGPLGASFMESLMSSFRRLPGDKAITR